MCVPAYSAYKCVDSPGHSPCAGHMAAWKQAYMDRDCLLLAALQVLCNVTSKSACDLRSVFLPLLFYKQSSQDEVMLLWGCQVRGKTAQ